MNPGLAVVLVVLFVVGACYASALLYPWRDCPSCGGARRIQGGGGIHRDCGRCGATGRVRRWGARRGGI